MLFDSSPPPSGTRDYKLRDEFKTRTQSKRLARPLRAICTKMKLVECHLRNDCNSYHGTKVWDFRAMVGQVACSENSCCVSCGEPTPTIDCGLSKIHQPQFCMSCGGTCDVMAPKKSKSLENRLPSCMCFNM